MKTSHLRNGFRLAIAAGLVTLSTCGPSSGPSIDPPDIPYQPDPGTIVISSLPASQQQELNQLISDLDETADMTAAEFHDRYAVPFAADIPYDPTTADHLPLIQSSSLALDQDELAKLGENGFVITDRWRFPSFVDGYATIYLEDLPVFVSADAIMFAVHRSYDHILKAAELEVLIPTLTTMLDEMRAALAAGGATALGTQAQVDADVFLAVAASLLRGELVAPVAGGDVLEISELFTSALGASGWVETILFGVERNMDFSQFTPRGHYTDSDELKRYFRAMMWLGRIDFRMLEAQPDGSLTFHRRQLEGALALRDLMVPATVNRWTMIDDAIQTFVGESDYMVLPELSALLADLGVGDDLGGLADISDDAIAQAILDGGYGTQRICSHIMINGIGATTMPLSSSFALFGQRYVIDSHVFSNVVYDRVQAGTVYRMMPDPLDVAFAALSNDQAGLLLDAELNEWGYAPDLHAMRVLADAHPEGFWQTNLYNSWLSALRTLSPDASVADPATAGIPSVAATEAWGRRLVNTQLASWAELRHDTILYAKQSYTEGASCEYPDAYVEPNPEFFASIVAFAQRGRELNAVLDLTPSSWLGAAITGYFDRLEASAARLEEMARHQQTGTPYTAEQLEFINQAVIVELGCGGVTSASGWYVELFFNVFNAVEYDPTIADVHTQPTDAGGTPVGRVLHVGTGLPRMMVVTVDTCTGPRAYVGLASAYAEVITEGFERLDDEAWRAELGYQNAEDVVWMRDLVVR